MQDQRLKKLVNIDIFWLEVTFSNDKSKVDRQMQFYLNIYILKCSMNNLILKISYDNFET